MRSAGCIVNDMWDRDIDGKVDRTKTRPLASGELTIKEACLPLIISLSCGLGVLT
jgi:4-hydroxybenzoate polyprenyltransferase